MSSDRQDNTTRDMFAERDRRTSRGAGLVIGAAIVSFGIGVVLWGSLISAAVSGVDDVLDENGNGSGQGGDVLVEEVDEADCDVLARQSNRSEEDEAAFQSQCITVTVEPSPTATEPPTPTIPPTDQNRFNCGEIRGTSYLSEEERTWYLDNCLTPTP